MSGTATMPRPWRGGKGAKLVAAARGLRVGDQQRGRAVFRGLAEELVPVGAFTRQRHEERPGTTARESTATESMPASARGRATTVPPLSARSAENDSIALASRVAITGLFLRLADLRRGSPALVRGAQRLQPGHRGGVGGTRPRTAAFSATLSGEDS